MISTIRHAYARYRMRYPIYFFHHLPKCGGTSVRQALDQWFYVNDDYFDEQSNFDASPIQLSELNSHNCISGHFGHQGYFIDQRYPQIFTGYRAAHRYRAFMFLREPLKMRCSLHRHKLKEGSNSSQNLASEIMHFNNFYARIINVTEDNWQERIDSYFFVGLADDLQRSFDVLARVIDKPAVELPISNTTIPSSENSYESLSESDRQAFKAANTLDYKIYEYAQRKLALLQAAN